MNAGRHLVILAAVAAVLVLGARQAAAACQTDADCATGEVCLPTPCPPCWSEEGDCPPCENVCARADDGGGFGGECASDADCAEGEVCEVYGRPCAVPPTCACACPDCADGEDCPPCECPPCEDEFAPCEEETAGYCIPRWEVEGCEADADCPAGFACEEIQVPCAATPCACGCEACEDPDDCPPCECEPCEQPECDPASYRTCVWAPASCESDADCDENFVCVAEEVCSGGGGCACPACPDGEECPPCDCGEDAFWEGCEVTGHHCEPAEIACADDTDCPADWTCEAGGADCICVACDCAAPPPCAEGEDCPDPLPCECPPCDCGGVSESVCAAPGWSGGWDDGGAYTPRPDGEDPQGDGTSGDGDAPPVDENGEPAQAAGDGGEGGEGGEGGNGAASDPPASIGGGATDPAAGCAAGSTSGAAPAGLALLLLLGAVLFRRARANR